MVWEDNEEELAHHQTGVAALACEPFVKRSFQLEFYHPGRLELKADHQEHKGLLHAQIHLTAIQVVLLSADKQMLVNHRLQMGKLAYY